MPKTPNPLLRRKSSSSPFSTLPRSKPTSTRKTTLSKEQNERLPDTGLVATLATTTSKIKPIPQDVLSLIRHIQTSSFSPVPDHGAGLSSTRTAEILRFRQKLPPIVSLAHLHALSKSSTATERELAKLVAEGVVRKITVPGRGRGGAAVGEGVVVVEDWIACVRREEGLGEEVREKYVALLGAARGAATTSTIELTNGEERMLVDTGFLTSPNALTAQLGDLFLPPGSSASLATVSSAGSRAATGTLAAVGGAGAVHESGGSGNTLTSRRDDNRTFNSIHVRGKSRSMTFALPGTGIYLKLLVSARQHLLHLLKALSPRHREATLEMLKEKWEGNTPNDPINRLKRERGEWGGVLPGKTKRWKEFYGMRFESVLAECVGSGLVELFDTGAVGMAVRGR